MFSLVPPANYRRRPSVRLSIRARAVSDITGARPFVPFAWADALLCLAMVSLGLGAVAFFVVLS